MAVKTALLSFEFEKLNELAYDPKFDYEFSSSDPKPGEGCQPLIQEAFTRIKQCLAASVSSSFKFGRTELQNMNNFLHIGTSVINAEVQNNDGSSNGQTNLILIVKFYRLEPKTSYKVTLDIEEMPTSSLAVDDPLAFSLGIDNNKIEQLVTILDKEFSLDGQVEYMPLIKRGRTDKPHYLISSDERLMEYDFDKVLFHKRSEFQDVKILSSPSLGNTLLLDNLQNLAEADIDYTYSLMDKGHVTYRNKEILILGGGDGGLLFEVLKEHPKFVTMAEIDPVVIEACRDHLKPFGKVLQKLEGPNYKIILDDCMKVLRQSVADGKKYDVIFNDLTDIPVTKREESLTAFDSSAVQKDNPWHFIEVIFNLSLDCLSDHGFYMNHATGKGSVQSLEAYEKFLSNSKIRVNYQKRYSYVPSFMEIWTFYTVSKSMTALGF